VFSQVVEELMLAHVAGVPVQVVDQVQS